MHLERYRKKNILHSNGLFLETIQQIAKKKFKWKHIFLI